MKSTTWAIPHFKQEAKHVLFVLFAASHFKHFKQIQTAKGADIFARVWAAKAKRLGWAEDELFGLHPTRVDRRGLAFLLHAGDRVVALDEDGADILTASGARQRFYRRPVGTNA